MRAFHASWICFFSAFIVWFAIPSIMPTIKKSLGLTQYQVYVSNIISVLATIFMRFLVGPLCEKYGPRSVMSVVLVIGSIPTFLIGTVTTYEGLVIIRFFIGTIGASFVMCQYWTTQMFTKEVVGTANAIVGGWGNLGGGVTHWLMGSALFPLFVVFTSGDTDLAWRTVFIVPAFLTLMVAWWSYYYSDDTPKGDLYEIRQKDALVGQLINSEARDGSPSSLMAFGKALRNPNTLLLMIQYGACFGVELTMYNATATYFFQEFKLNQVTIHFIVNDLPQFYLYRVYTLYNLNS
jgi:NNP family nitrate/nitrite transporter-like MFS transporter